MTCKKVSNSRAGRFPCLRYKITDIRLFKPGQVPGFEWTRRWNNNISDPIQNWASEDLKTIFISDGLSNRFVEVQVRRFIPQAGDKLERTWDFKGMKKSVSIPPYALVKLEDVKKAYSEHIQESMREAFGSLLGRPESLLYQTYDRAWRIFRDPSTPMECLDLIGRTLMLWMSIRLTTRSSFIVGTETLGMPRDILDETSPNHGMIPLPPVLGAQLDLVLIHHIQTRLRRELLDRLQKTIQKNKQSTWLVTYLVTFILLHNTALITGHDAGYARKHGMKVRTLEPNEGKTRARATFNACPSPRYLGHEIANAPCARSDDSPERTRLKSITWVSETSALLLPSLGKPVDQHERLTHGGRCQHSPGAFPLLQQGHLSIF